MSNDFHYSLGVIFLSATSTILIMVISWAEAPFVCPTVAAPSPVISKCSKKEKYYNQNIHKTVVAIQFRTLLFMSRKLEQKY